MDDVVYQRLLEKVANDLYGTTEVKSETPLLDFKAPYKRISMYDAIKEHTGIDISSMNEARAGCLQATGDSCW